MVEEQAKSYRLGWKFVPRLATEHLGQDKYSTSMRAVGELVSNSFDARATKVTIGLNENELGGVTSILVADNGIGISPTDVRERFVLVGVAPNGAPAGPNRFGRFGVGRLAVFRIGGLSEWTSVSKDKKGSRTRVSFKLVQNGNQRIQVTEEVVSKTTPLGTTITVYNLRDSGTEALHAGRLANDLMAQFCSYLIGNPEKTIVVQGETIDVASLVESRRDEVIPARGKVPNDAILSHLLLRRNVDKSRLSGQLLFSAKGRTVATEQPEETPTPRYLGIVECPYLDSIVTSNREAIINMDDGFGQLRSDAIRCVHDYAEQFKEEKDRRFIERARQEDFYPFRQPSGDPVRQVQQAVYDVVLEKVHENINLENMSNRQKQVVFRLLQRSLVNENLLEILSEVASLSDDDMEKFRRVLEQTTLNSIIKLSSEVTDRIAFLDVLHGLVYGDVSKFIKERSQLHKILEPNCWLFGQRFYLATSDKSFRTIVAKHRSIAELPNLSREKLNSIEGAEDIPDLFLAATREYPMDPKVHNVLVELKSPSVPLGRKEVEQIRRYAETILKSDEFDKLSTNWDIFLVSACARDEINRDRKQKDRRPGVLYEWDNMTVWAFEWSELIAQSRTEMNLVRQHLQQKSKELKVSDYLRSNFPSILENLESHLE